MKGGTWADVDFTLSAEDAIRDCIKREIMTYGTRKFQVRNTHPGFKANYSGYGRVGIDEIEAGNGICYWFDGLVVMWPDVFWDDRTLPLKKIPVSELDDEQRAKHAERLEWIKPYIYHHRREEYLNAKS